MRTILIVLFISFGTFYSQSIYINEVMASNSTVLQDEDNEYSDWIELYNPTASIINLSGFAISDDTGEPRKWVFPNVNIQPYNYLIVFASEKNKTTGELHTNFKISADGEEIILTDTEEQIIDQLDPTPIPVNISLGRSIDDPSQWLFYSVATPGAVNDTEGYAAFSEAPIFSIYGGFYTGNISLELSTESGIVDIYYTTDGSDPTESSSVYSSPISIDQTTVIRTRIFEAGLLPSKIVTHTYFVNENFSLPVVSLSTNPANFWDNEIGIYVAGNNGIPGNCLDTPANWNQDWARPIHIEFYETDGTQGFSIDARVGIHGGCTRRYPQKGLKIMARGEYGNSSIPYKLFPDLPYEEYPSILLRPSGNDRKLTFFRDALMHSLVKNLDLETQAYRPVVVFLNGQYFGIHNVREKINENYLNYRKDANPENVDILESKGYVVEGDAIHYNMMLDFIENNSIANETNYQVVKSFMDVDNYINYMVSQVYFTNRDWYPNNTKYWRNKTSEGIWRWLLFDTDYGFSAWTQQGYIFNMFSYLNDETRYSSIIYRKLKLNSSFKNQFINTFLDYANTIFKSENVISKINEIAQVIEPEIARHISKWGDFSNGWGFNVEFLRTFANERLSYAKQHFINEFNLGPITNVNLFVENSDFGHVKLNSIILEEFPWSGEYFQGIPIVLEAVPKPGYQFVGWTGSVTTSERIISYTPGSNNNITAVFEEDHQTYPVVINEINYNSPSENEGEPARPDWIELYNNSDDPVDISSWQFKDEGHIFVIPDGTLINGREYLVIAENDTAFQFYYPSVANVLSGSFEFGLGGGGEEIALYSLNGSLIDTLEYDDKTPWPTEPDGNGPTLELIHPDLDNSIGNNWRSSNFEAFGTPGRINDSFRDIYEPIALPKIVINEINYNSPDEIEGEPVRPDWIELYNNSDEPVDLSGWQFKDEDNTFIIPGGTVLNASEYLVLTDTVSNFQFYFTTVTNVLSEGFGFGLSNGGELLSLFNQAEILIDQVDYDDIAPWPIDADGNGPTLELIHPDSNNVLAENWAASLNIYGTPGNKNSIFFKEFPCVVEFIRVVPFEDKIILEWNKCKDDALEFYALYRFTNPDFSADSVDGYTYSVIDTFFIDTDVEIGNTYYYQIAAFDTNGFRSSYSEKAFALVTDVNQNDLLPTNFELFQNYPNPFNPYTTIKYSIPFIDGKFNAISNVVLKVYDVLGREVITLVDKKQKPGNYEVIFNAGNLNRQLSSGVYYYKFITDNFIQTKKMLIVR